MKTNDSDSDSDLGQALLALARHAIADEFGFPHAADPQHPALALAGATFVTLTEHGLLRGCIGTLDAHRPLGEDVRANAHAAAFRDPRFAPLRYDEFSDVRVEVSLLAEAQPMEFRDEADALRQLRPGIDGVILEAGPCRATFLPQVWESLPVPRQFIEELKCKAGLPANYWNDDVRLSRYEVRKWKERT